MGSRMHAMTMYRSYLRHAPLGIACLYMLLRPAFAGAQTPVASAPESSPGELEEVTVTATKRKESEQSVPLSMTTFSTAALQEKSINTFVDYATKVPNLAFAQTGDGVGTSRTVSIRGISGDNVTAIYLDETPLPDSIDPRILDVDHIEVLRGPQGDLYGARSMGGTVRIITKSADYSNFEASVHGQVGHTEDAPTPNYTGDAVFNIPLVKDRVVLRFSGFYDEQGGYFKRSFCTNPATAGVTCFPLSTSGITTLNNIGATDTSGAALSLGIKVTDSFTITPRVMLQRASYNGFPLADYRSTPGNGIGYPVPTPATGVNVPTLMEPSGLTQARFFNVPEGGTDRWDLYSLGMHWSTAAGELISSTAYFDRRVFESEDESDFVYAVVTSGAGGLPVPSTISELKDYQRLVQEIRWASTLSGPIQFVAGAFYSDFHGRLPYASYYPPAIAPGLDATLLGPGGGQITPGYPDTVYGQDFHTDIKEPALFGNASYTWNAWKLTAGLRYSQVRIRSYGYELGLATGGGPPIDSPVAVTSEHGIDPKVELDYHVDPDRMIYALASKGFRPGGLVPIVPAGIPGTVTDCVASLKAADPNLGLADTRAFHSDSLWNYELGAKTAWLDRRVIVNAAGFFIDWNNIQQQVLLSCGYQFVANAGRATSKGGELEFRGRVLDPLELSAGVGYQNAKIVDQGVGPQPAGSPIYNVPNWTANAAITYTVPINSSWSMLSVADYSYVGSSYSANNDPAEPRERPSYRLINLRLALEHGPYELALVGKNLANEIESLGDSRSLAQEVPGRPRLFINEPRTIGLEMRASF